MADHFDARGLLPAAADDGIATCGFKADQAHEPLWHAAGVRLGVALHQYRI